MKYENHLNLHLTINDTSKFAEQALKENFPMEVCASTYVVLLSTVHLYEMLVVTM